MGKFSVDACEAHSGAAKSADPGAAAKQSLDLALLGVQAGKGKDKCEDNYYFSHKAMVWFLAFISKDSRK
ncbi:MAG: hypothetical protein AMS26_00170 [Bacteroides sp. SM23_62]|nr:MAG: hypothetical protein AMS26_00170 [Bacteroides sp. SM23_62]